MFRRRGDQLAPPQMRERCMDGAFGEACCISNRAHTGVDAGRLAACGLSEEVQVNDERGRPLIVSDQIAHQHVEYVIVDGNDAFETRISK